MTKGKVTKYADIKTNVYCVSEKKYFYQMSSKSIVIILSYTVSKFARFLRHSVGVLQGNSVQLL